MAPIKSTKFGYMSMFTDKVEDDNFLVGIGATFNTTQVFEPGNGYKYVIYTASGYLNVTSGGPVDVLLVGGGGGGGNGARKPSPTAYYGGGGGGAGGLLEKFNIVLPIGFYDVKVGDGGVPNPNVGGSPSDARLGVSGSPSYISGPTITDLIAYGGGGGGGAFDAPPNTLGSNGSDGGSGGGSGAGGSAGDGNRTTATHPATGSPIPTYLQPSTSTQGNPGGISPSTLRGGGGGGAGAAGESWPPTVNGGIGRVGWSGDDGIPSSYGTPGPTPGRWFAGGGGGGGPIRGSGGDGGGGDGGDGSPPALNPSTAGTINTGGGGGGGHSDQGINGEDGGSGIIIIRYKI